MKAKRRITCALVTHVSLVDKGANKKTIIWKSGDDPVYTTVVSIAKTDDDLRMVYGVVYAPEQVDSQGDIADAAVIRDAAYNFMKSRYTTNVDKQHDFNVDEGFVAESWIVRKGDPLFSGEPDGAWAVGIKVLKEDTWQAVKKGELTGLSMAGYAELDELDEEDEDEPIKKNLLRKFAEWLGLNKDFNSALQNETRRRAIYTLEDTLQQIWGDEKLDESAKMQAAAQSIDQFKSFLVGGITKSVEIKMTIEELTKAVNDAVASAVAPLAARIEFLEKGEAVTKAVKDAVDPVAARLETLEKSSPGSRQEKGQEGDKKVKGLQLF